MSSSINLYLDTRDSVGSNSEDHNPADVSFQLPHSFRMSNAAFIELEHVFFPNVIYPIRAGVNDTFTFQENGTASDLDATLTEQNYTGTQLAAELQTQMNSAGANTYAVSYDSQTKKLTITLSAGTSYKIMTGNANDPTGFNSSVGFTALATIAANPVRLDGIEFLEVVCGNLPLNNYASNGKFNVLGIFHVDVPFGNVYNYQNKSNNRQRFNAQDFSSIDLRIYDNLGNILSMPNNSHILYHIKLSF